MPSVICCESFEEFVRTTEPNPQTVSVFLLEHDETLSDGDLEALGPWSQDEWTRMAGFREPKSKTSWCAARYLFRSVLDRIAADHSTADRRIEGHNTADQVKPGPFGKPYLPDSPLTFNWSHTTGCVLLALSCENEVGCDIEDSYRAMDSFSDIADSYFHVAEREWIRAGSSLAERRHRFLATFVEKEARVKMTGSGLTESMRGFCSTLELLPYCRDRVLALRYPELSGDPGSGRYFAAVYCESAPETITVKAHRLSVRPQTDQR